MMHEDWIVSMSECPPDETVLSACRVNQQKVQCHSRAILLNSHLRTQHNKIQQNNGILDCFSVYFT